MSEQEENIRVPEYFLELPPVGNDIIELGKGLQDKPAIRSFFRRLGELEELDQRASLFRRISDPTIQTPVDKSLPDKYHSLLESGLNQREKILKEWLSLVEQLPTTSNKVPPDESTATQPAELKKHQKMCRVRYEDQTYELILTLNQLTVFDTLKSLSGQTISTSQLMKMFELEDKNHIQRITNVINNLKKKFRQFNIELPVHIDRSTESWIIEDMNDIQVEKIT
jgi:hypothetical protein